MSGPPDTDVFFPSGGTTVSPPPGSYVVPLADTRFIFKGMFFDPVQDKHAPLPPHHFYMFDLESKGKLKVRGEQSQPDGVSWMLYDIDGSGSSLMDAEGSRWTLAWMPMLKDPSDGSKRAPRASVVSAGEVWIDLDEKEWVAPDEVARMERRRLIRLPLWASFVKSWVGGFIDGPPKTDFSSTGVLEQEKGELAPYGTPDKPWLVHIDHKLFRSYVRFHYYDLKEKKRKPVPRGPVIEGRGVRRLSVGEAGRVAGGTAIDKDGTVYLLHERTKRQSGDLHYLFRSSVGKDISYIDFKVEAPVSDPPDERVKIASSGIPERLDERYLLPTVWCSVGVEAWVHEDGHGFPGRSPFTDLRKGDTSKKQPLCFHLDDAVIAAGPMDPIPIGKDTKVTVFDRLLHIREPDPDEPHRYKRLLQKNYLPAEDMVYLNGEGLERVTLLVYHEGIFYELREKRITDKVGTTDGVGLRAAMANDFGPLHRRADYMEGVPTQPPTNLVNARGPGRAEYHLIDPQVPYSYPGKSGAVAAKLVHLLVFFPVTLDASKVKASTAKEFWPKLIAAGEWHDTEHPGHPGKPEASGDKNYALVPGKNLSAGAKIVKVRHFFGPAPKTFPNVITMRLLDPDPKGDNRGNANAVTRLVNLITGDTGMGAGGVPDEGQDASTTRFVLPHECHHILGYPDEYFEGLPGHAVTKWDQYAVASTAARPFGADRPSVMNSGSATRLRHHWVYANRLAQEADFRAMLDSATYLPEYAKFPGGGLTYELPAVGPSVLPDAANKGPLVPINPGFYPPGTMRCDATLYRLGDDEGTVRRMFAKAGGPFSVLPPAERYSGILVIRIKMMVEFDAAISDALTRAIHLTQVAELFVNGQGQYQYFFAILADTSAAAPGTVAALPRIAVAFHTEFDVANNYTAKGQPVPSGAHFTLKFLPASTPIASPKLLQDNPAQPIELHMGDINLAIGRYALGLKTWFQGVGNTREVQPITLAQELDPMAAYIGSVLLKDAPGVKRKVVVP